MLYVTFQKLREQVKKRFGVSSEEPHPPANLPTTTT
jgi:hypothetical protein